MSAITMNIEVKLSELELRRGGMTGDMGIQIDAVRKAFVPYAAYHLVKESMIREHDCFIYRATVFVDVNFPVAVGNET